MKEVLGVDRIVAQELEDRAVIRVRPRPSHHVQHRPRLAPVLRVEVARDQVELGDRVGIRRHVAAVAELRSILAAVQIEVVIANAIAVDGHRVRVVGAGNGSGDVDRAGHKSDQVVDIPAGKRQVLDPLLIDRFTDLHVHRVHQRRIRDHFHNLFDRPDLQRKIDTRILIHVERNAGPLLNLETARFGFQEVITNSHNRKQVRSRRTRRGGLGLMRIRVRQPDSRAGNLRSARIGNGTGNRPGGRLAGDEPRHQPHENCQTFHRTPPDRGEYIPSALSCDHFLRHYGNISLIGESRDGPAGHGSAVVEKSFSGV